MATLDPNAELDPDQLEAAKLGGVVEGTGPLAQQVADEVGVTDAQRRMQSLAYELAKHDDFDFRDPANIAALQAEATKLRESDPALQLRAAMRQHLPNLDVAQKQELAQSFLEHAGEAAPAAVPSQAAPVAAEQAAVPPAPTPEDLINATVDSPAATYALKQSMLDQADSYKALADEADQAQQKIKDDTELEKQKQLVGVAQDYEKRLTEINEHWQDQMDGQLGRYRQSVDELRAVNPNPFATRDASWAITSALFAGFTQLGLGMAGSNAPNQSIQMIKDTLNNDLQAQQAELDVKRGGVMREGQLLERMREVWGDNKLALQATKVAMLDHVEAQAKRQLASMAPQMRDAKAAETLSLVAAERQKENVKLVDMAQVHKNNNENNDRKAAHDVAEAQRRLIEAQTRSVNLSTKAAGKDEETYSKFVGDLLSTKGAPDVAQAKKQLVAADVALAMATKYRNLDDMPIGDYHIFLEELGKVATGGVPTEGMLHNLDQSGFAAKVRNESGKTVGQVYGAGLGKFIKNNVEYLKEVADIHKEHVGKYERSQFVKYKHRMSPSMQERAKEEFPHLFEETPKAEH